MTGKAETAPALATVAYSQTKRHLSQTKRQNKIMLNNPVAKS